VVLLILYQGIYDEARVALKVFLTMVRIPKLLLPGMPVVADTAPHRLFRSLATW